MALILHQLAKIFCCQLLLAFVILQHKYLSAIAQHHRLSTDLEITSSMLNDTTVLIPDSLPLDEPVARCQPLQIPFCEQVNYNSTVLPNDLGHKRQQEVAAEIAVYEPLVTKACSPNMRLFICTFYAPICYDHDNGSGIKLGPCKSLCESVRQGCEPLLKKFDQTWPEGFNCDKFPDGRKKGVLCVGNDSHNSMDSYEKETSPGIRMDPGFVCPKNFEKISYSLHFNGRTHENCAMPCDDVYLDKNATGIVRLVAGIVAVFCIISSTFACITFLIDTRRFQYPIRPIIIIAFCQLVVASCYLVGYLSSNKIACNEPDKPIMPNVKMIRTMTMGNKKGSCTLLFMTLYFSQMSAVYWWLMMTVSWYMIAKLKWAPESVSGYSRYFHICSWTLPALHTLFLSVLGDIEGDPLSGTCFVSASIEASARNHLIIPSILCLLFGIILLALGFKSIWDDRMILRSISKDQTDEHYKLIIRIGLYSILFIVFTTTFIASHYYEQSNQTIWKYSWLSTICKDREYSIPCPQTDYRNQGPHYLLFMTRHVAAMAIGVVTMGFMLSEKTVKAYKDAAETYPVSQLYR